MNTLIKTIFTILLSSSAKAKVEYRGSELFI